MMSLSSYNQSADDRKALARSKIQRELFAKTPEAKAMKDRVDDLWRLNQLLSHPGSVQGEPPADTQKIKRERRRLLDELRYETYDPDTALEGIRQALLLEVFNKARLVSDRYDMLAESAAMRIGADVGIRLEDGRFDPEWKLTAINPEGVVTLEQKHGAHEKRDIPIESLLETNTGRVI